MIRTGLGMSGGVDSTVAAKLLQNQGYEVVGITLSLCDGIRDSSADIADAKRVCEKLSIEHFAPNFSPEFKEEIIGNFINEYLNANTPNPCILCNERIKFGKMLSFA